MKAVLDSNIFISSFFWKGNPRKVFDRVPNGQDELFIKDEILKEIWNFPLLLIIKTAVKPLILGMEYKEVQRQEINFR
ncbi:MAG: hypothetical protein LBD29_04730 [Treponema sp.]|jgi:predicted nucleic acid-binding protein|nr:hypothetical protein [Treponema sp.]